MQTRVHEIADGIYRLSTFVAEVLPSGLTFNQFLVLGDEPLLFHCGPRRMFPLVREAMARVVAPEQLRWITYGHFEADECGSLNEWLAAAPRAEAAQGVIGCGVSLSDFADRPPRMLADGEAIELGGGKRLRFIDTPHTPHGWDAGLLFEEQTGTLLCGDLFTQPGDSEPLVETEIVSRAIETEDIFGYSALNPGMGGTLRRLAQLAPTTLALMHGPAFRGDGGAALSTLADEYNARIRKRLAAELEEGGGVAL